MSGTYFIIAGSRDCNIGYNGLRHALELLNIHINPDYDTIVSGGCPTGPDAAAKLYAAQHRIEYREYPADWNAHGKMAGPIRNAEMALHADELILIWDGESRGSANMRSIMTRYGKPVHELIIPKKIKKVKY